ncbi:uncharacterized protein LOC109532191 isoform X2 [Hippocampus comes]|uniref:uncharacterized protein LOC109532191 isoform X2 n=1 Tax=Hippocampus comes TaxID=109280 RepID=UPI00094EF9BA|nr:PREDICTED: uncharacterized protein LOC109532191 isoform X2 [Hippocampus comes]
MAANVEWDLLLEVINADLNQQQVNVTAAEVNQMPVEVLDAQLFYELAQDSFFLPSPPPPPPPPPPKATNFVFPDKKKRKTGAQDSSRPYIKKPLNAFMLFMKEQRPVVKAQFLHKDSATVNKIMGQMVIFCVCATLSFDTNACADTVIASAVEVAEPGTAGEILRGIRAAHRNPRQHIPGLVLQRQLREPPLFFPHFHKSQQICPVQFLCVMHSGFFWCRAKRKKECGEAQPPVSTIGAVSTPSPIVFVLPA